VVVEVGRNLVIARRGQRGEGEDWAGVSSAAAVGGKGHVVVGRGGIQAGDVLREDAGPAGAVVPLAHAAAVELRVAVRRGVEHAALGDGGPAVAGGVAA